MGPEVVVGGMPLPERWVLGRMEKVVGEVTEDLESYNFGAAGARIYEFLWDDLADWYVEISKTRLYEGLQSPDELLSGEGGEGAEAFERRRETARRVLVHTVDRTLRILHPFMPFVTEHLFQHIPRVSGTGPLMLSPWPSPRRTVKTLTSSPDFVKAEDDFGMLQGLVRSIRNARAEYGVEQSRKIEAWIVVDGEETAGVVRGEVKAIALLAKVDEGRVRVVVRGGGKGEEEVGGGGRDVVRCFVDERCEAVLPKSGLIDAEKESSRLRRSREKNAREIDKLRTRLNGEGFVDKAPENVVGKAREELRVLEDRQGKIEEQLRQLEDGV